MAELPLGRRFGQCPWAVSAVCASLCMSGGGFCMAAIGKFSADPQATNVSALFVVWTAVGVCGVVGLLAQAATVGALHGLGDRKNGLLSVVAGLFNAGGMLCLTLALALAPDSAGPITAMLPLGAVLTCVLARLLLSEALTTQQIVGVFICICGPVCMALSNGTHSQCNALMLALCAACSLGLFAFAKKTARTRGASPFSVVLVIYLVSGITGASGMNFCWLSGRGLIGLTFTTTAVAVLSGFFWGLGTAFFQLALISGKVGPATAILNTNSVGVLVLTVIFWAVVPPALKLLGMALCVVGVIVLALAQPSSELPAFEQPMGAQKLLG